MWSENKIKTYRRKLKKEVKEIDKFFDEFDSTINIHRRLYNQRKEKKDKLNFEISVLERVLN